MTVDIDVITSKFIFLYFLVLIHPHVGLPSPSLTTQMLVGHMPMGGARLWTRILDKSTRVDHPESVKD